MNDQSSNKTIVVTGVNGFVGGHLTKELKKYGYKVIGIGMEPKPATSVADLLDQYLSADLTKVWPVKEEVGAVIHLAGLAAVGPSFDQPQKYINLNSAMITHACEYYVSQTYKPRFLVVSSGAVYSSKQSMPLNEQSDISMSSPYVVSKMLVESQCSYYRSRDLDIVVARPFNHIGPGQTSGFIVPDLADQAINNADVIVGNIETRRDYTDVRDVARAYRLLVEAGDLSSNIYNICSGKSTSGQEILSMISDKLNKRFNTIVDQDKFRPTDAMDIYGNSDALHKDTGWEATITTRRSVSDYIDSMI